MIMSKPRLANVYARASDLIIAPSSLTVCGVWIGASPVSRLVRTVPAEQIGAAVRQALAASQCDVPHPTDWKSVGTELLTVARLRSWNALERAAASCSVVSQADVLRVIPHRNGGTKGPDRGYHPLEEYVIEIGITSSDEELGTA